MSTSYGTITLTNETEAKKAARYFLHSSGGSYVIAGNSQSFNPSDESTYGFNVRSGTNEIQLRYNNKVLSEWRGGDGTQNSNLVFYDTTNAASTQLALKKLMELTSAGLNFYKKGDDSTAAASLTTNGLEIKEGSITLGAEDQTTHRHPFEVNSNGELYAENATISGDIYAAYIEAKTGDIGGWKVTDHIDYELNPSYSAWYVTNYNQTKSFATTYSYPVQEVIPKKVKIKFSGSLNGLNINDDVIYEYDITELDTDYIIEYSGLNVGKAKLTFNGTDTVTFYLTKTLDDGIILELRGLNYILRNNNAGALYYGGLLPGGYLSNIVLSGQGVYSNTTVAGSDPGETWKIAVGNNFGVTTNGTLYATSAKISGHLKAFTLSTGNRSSSSTGTAGTYIDEYGAIYVGSDNAFQVTAAGAVTATSISIKGNTLGTSDSIYLGTSDLSSSITINGHSATDWRILVGNKFGVDKNGNLYANGANLTGLSFASLSDVYAAEGRASQTATTYIGSKTTPDDSATGIAIAQSNPTNATTFNFLNTDGMRIYKDNIKLASFDGTGMSLYRINNNNEGIKIANFGSTIQLGPDSRMNMTLDPSNGMFFKNGSSTYGGIQIEAWNGNTPGLRINGFGGNAGTYNQGNTCLVMHSTGAYLLASTDTTVPVTYGGQTNWVEINSNGTNIGAYNGTSLSFPKNTSYAILYGKIYSSNSDGYLGAIFSGTTTPSSSTGAIGDIYIKYTS